MPDKKECHEDRRNPIKAWDAYEAIFREGVAKHRRWLDETAGRIGVLHKLECRNELRTLLAELHILSIDHASEVTIEPGKVRVPSDLGGWKAAREKLQNLASAMDEAYEKIYAAVEDPVQRAALIRVDPEGHFAELFVGVGDMNAIIQQAAVTEGKGGNQPNPDWHAHAADACRNFWLKHRGEKPRPHFNPVTKPKKGELARNVTTEPANAFSRWFCDVMHTVAENVKKKVPKNAKKKVQEMTVTKCKTALEKARPQKKSKYWTHLP